MWNFWLPLKNPAAWGLQRRVAPPPGTRASMHGRASTALSAAGPLRSFMFPARPWSALDIVAQVCTAKSGQATYLVYLLVGRMALAKS